jgi:hypothetical protein
MKGAISVSDHLRLSFYVFRRGPSYSDEEGLHMMTPAEYNPDDQ